ncbi:MAG: hypothetical protein ACYC99_09740 [Candidatus Geothermincolia bacterium]
MENEGTGQECTAEIAAPDYVNADDLFYWMEDPGGADIPLCALWIDVPTGCRFCC